MRKCLLPLSLRFSRFRRYRALVAGLALAPAAGLGSLGQAAVAPIQAEVEESAKIADLRPNVPPDFNPRQHGLAPQPLIVETLGLGMHYPAESFVSVERVERSQVVSLVDSSDHAAWAMTIQLLVPTGEARTAEQQMEDHLRGLRDAGRPHRIILNEATRYGGVNGRLFYLEEQLPHSEPHISGFLMLPMGDGLLLVFSILTTPTDLPRLQQVFRASFETISLRSAAELSLQRRSRLDSGRDFLTSLTPERLRSLVGLQLWSRIYRPGPPGSSPMDATEVGYSLLNISEAKRGELNPDRSPGDYTPVEAQDGLLVRVQGRIIGDVDRNLYYDTIALYWLAWDQSEEAWVVRGTQRQGRASRSEAETGNRVAPTVGEPIPMLTVIHSSQAMMSSDRGEWSVPDVYLSQALSSLLGRLLPRNSHEAREFAYYFYHSSQRTPQLTQRIDRWEPDGRGNWTLTTRFSSDTPPIVSLFSPRGELIRSTRPDGTVTEPINPDDLRRLWERKGLPITEREERQRGRQSR